MHRRCLCVRIAPEDLQLVLVQPAVEETPGQQSVKFLVLIAAGPYRR
jgi:hypothetical protein